MKLEHIAIKTDNIKESIEWYQENLEAEMLYEDETWGLVSIHGTKVAFVLDSMHPPHICFEVTDEKRKELELVHELFKYHRDGSAYLYMKDNARNTVEFLVWPENKNVIMSH